MSISDAVKDVSCKHVVPFQYKKCPFSMLNCEFFVRSNGYWDL